MVEVVRTEDFDQWLTKLKDKAGRLRILKRIDRLVNGNPGYRVYYLRDGDVLILLLCGGDKSTQQNDIDKAHRLAEQWRNDIQGGTQ